LKEREDFHLAEFLTAIRQVSVGQSGLKLIKTERVPASYAKKL
jgi:hypothetical protein